jgi:4-aminobutyrate aminotransferase
MGKLHKSEGDINISHQREEWQKNNIDTKSRRLLEEDARYFLKQSLSTPCLNTMRHCEGIYIEDIQGRRYMDFHGNNVHQVGFANADVITAIKKQLDKLSFCSRRYTNRVAVDLAKKLAEIAPGDLNKSLFCPGGAEAVGMAIKLARVATGRHKTISMWDSFHGATLDTISIGGEAIFRQNIGPLLPGCEHVPPPNWNISWKKKVILQRLFPSQFVARRISQDPNIGKKSEKPVIGMELCSFSMKSRMPSAVPVKCLHLKISG